MLRTAVLWDSCEPALSEASCLFPAILFFLQVWLRASSTCCNNGGAVQSLTGVCGVSLASLQKEIFQNVTQWLGCYHLSYELLRFHVAPLEGTFIILQSFFYLSIHLKCMYLSGWIQVSRALRRSRKAARVQLITWFSWEEIAERWINTSTEERNEGGRRTWCCAAAMCPGVSWTIQDKYNMMCVCVYIYLGVRLRDVLSRSPLKLLWRSRSTSVRFSSVYRLQARCFEALMEIWLLGTNQLY